MWAEVWRAERPRREWHAPNKANFPGGGETGGASPTLRPGRRAGRTTHGERIVRNKPNFRWPRHPTIPVFHHSSMPIRRRLRETNPIRSDAARDGTSGTRGECAKQTQFGPGAQEWARAAGSPLGSECAKQSQFPPEQREGQVPCRKGIMVNHTCNRLRQNKANLARVSSSKCQVLSVKSGKPGGESSASSYFRLYTSPFRRNAASQGLSCETKPIWLVGESPGEGNAQNKPNLARAPRNRRGTGESPAELSLRRMAPNKPNLRQAGWEDHRQEPALSAANGPEALTLPPAGLTCETKPIWYNPAAAMAPAWLSQRQGHA
jgi:hypothetical protein